MAAIKESKGAGLMNIKLTSSEFPELFIEGKVGQRSNLKKELNKMIKEKRRISGGPTGKTSQKLEDQRSKKALDYLEQKSDVQDAGKSNIGGMGPDANQYKTKTKEKPTVKKRTTVKKKDDNKGWLDKILKSLSPGAQTAIDKINRDNTPVEKRDDYVPRRKSPHLWADDLAEEIEKKKDPAFVPPEKYSKTIPSNLLRRVQDYHQAINNNKTVTEKLQDAGIEPKPEELQSLKEEADDVVNPSRARIDAEKSGNLALIRAAKDQTPNYFPDLMKADEDAGKTMMPPPPKRYPKPKPKPQPQPSPENKFKAPEDDLTNEGDFEDEMRDAEEFGKLRVNKKDKKKILLAEDILRNRDKDSTARIRESTGDFYIDPFTGFALDMNIISRSNRRAEDMEIASMMPANKRAAFFYQKGIITKSDLDKLLEPTEMEQLQIDVQKAKLAESNLRQAKYKRETKDYLSPREKQKLDMYGANFRNAVTNDNIQGQIWWGKKLGMDVDKMIKDTKKVDKVPSDLSKHFKKRYGVEYNTVVNQRVDLYKQAAKVLQTGEIGDYQVGSKVVSSRKEFLRAQGLDDWTSPKLQKLRAENNLEALKEYLSPERFPLLPKTEDGGVNYQAILKDADSFYEFVTQNFVHKQMNDYHPGGTYEAMMREYHHYLQSNPYYSKVKQ